MTNRFTPKRCEKISEGDAERRRQSVERDNAHVALTALHAADIVAVEPRTGREFFLRDVEF